MSDHGLGSLLYDNSSLSVDVDQDAESPTTEEGAPPDGVAMLG